MQRTGLMAGALALISLAAGCGGSSSSSSSSSAAPSTSQTQTAPTFRSIEQGTTSGVSSETFFVADDATAWAMTWNRHRPGAPIPVVDFSRERVVGVFLGDRPTGGHSVEVVSVAQVTSDVVEVGYVATRPSGAATAQVTQPFHLVTLADAVGAIRFVEQTAPPATLPLTDAHGTLVEAPARAGGQALAFLQDGASEALELVDPSALAAAGGYAGATLVVTGASEVNPTGLTSLAESLRVRSFALDTVRTTARVEQTGSAVQLRDVEGNLFDPTGPLAASLPGLTDRPLRITGHLDPTSQRLVLTTVRETRSIAIRIAGGLAGLNEQFWVDDLTHTGAARYDYSLYIQPTAARRGRGSLAASDRDDLERLALAAALHTQPKSFRPTGFVVADAPSTTITFADRDGESQITILYGATLPPAVDALLQRLSGLRTVLPAFRVLASGGFSQVTQAGAQVVRTQAELDTLWRAHNNTIGAVPPTVDFTKELVVAVFMGRQPSGGYGIAVERLEQVGGDLRLAIERSAPTPGAPVTAVITSPFQLVAVEHKGAVDVYVDNTKP